MIFELAYGDGIAIHADITQAASWNNVEAVLKKMGKKSSMSLTIQRPHPQEGKSFSLRVADDENYYLPTMGGGGGGVFQLINYDRNDLYDLYVGGDIYPSYMVTEDFEYVRNMAKTFYETGDVYIDMWVINDPNDPNVALHSNRIEMDEW